MKLCGRHVAVMHLRSTLCWAEIHGYRSHQCAEPCCFAAPGARWSCPKVAGMSLCHDLNSNDGPSPSAVTEGPMLRKVLYCLGQGSVNRRVQSRRAKANCTDSSLIRSLLFDRFCHSFFISHYTIHNFWLPAVCDGYT